MVRIPVWKLGKDLGANAKFQITPRRSSGQANVK